MRKPLKQIATTEKSDLIHLLSDFDEFLFEDLLDVHKECCPSYLIRKIQRALNPEKPYRNFRILFPRLTRRFSLEILECIRRRSVMKTNPKIESSRILITEWRSKKNEILSRASEDEKDKQKEFLSIANKLASEILLHLLEILADERCLTIDRAEKQLL